VKSTLLDSRLRTNASIFYTEIGDYQVQQQLETGIGTRVSNQGDVETAGLDLNIEGLPLPNLTLTAGLLYMDKREITSGPDRGLELPFTAEYSGTLSATLVYPWAAGYLYTRADYSYMDDHLTNASAQTEEKDIQERTNVNLRAGWRDDHWNASIWAKNLTDDAYASLTAETLPLSGVDAYFLAPPRTYGFTLRYDF
jgi:iron complex outermembrane receptor protein